MRHRPGSSPWFRVKEGETGRARFLLGVVTAEGHWDGQRQQAGGGGECAAQFWARCARFIHFLLQFRVLYVFVSFAYFDTSFFVLSGFAPFFEFFLHILNSSCISGCNFAFAHFVHIFCTFAFLGSLFALCNVEEVFVFLKKIRDLHKCVPLPFPCCVILYVVLWQLRFGEHFVLFGVCGAHQIFPGIFWALGLLELLQVQISPGRQSMFF